jgi:hypothetical protein
VTNKGIGGLLNKWGQGASLIRGEWKARVRDHNMESGSGSDMEDDKDRLENGRQRPPHMDGGDVLGSSTDDILSSKSLPPPLSLLYDSPPPDGLADAMSSLSLVPNKIRFGRGGKKGGFAHPHASKPADKSKAVHAQTPAEICPNDQIGDGKAGQSKRRGRRRGAHRKASEGTSSTSGDLDAVAMQD